MDVRLILGSAGILVAMFFLGFWVRARRARDLRVSEKRRSGIDEGKHVEM
ncbi:MAG: hypothetical protein ABSF50_09700 [Burkholderiaceae bacterium]|jgi:hypothetical protein